MSGRDGRRQRVGRALLVAAALSPLLMPILTVAAALAGLLTRPSAGAADRGTGPVAPGAPS